MKIYTNRPKNNWISPYTVLEKVFFWRKGYDAFAKEPPAALSKACEIWHNVAKVINPDIEYIKIDYWDVWSMDTALLVLIQIES